MNSLLQMDIEIPLQHSCSKTPILKPRLCLVIASLLLMTFGQCLLLPWNASMERTAKKNRMEPQEKTNGNDKKLRDRKGIFKVLYDICCP